MSQQRKRQKKIFKNKVKESAEEFAVTKSIGSIFCLKCTGTAGECIEVQEDIKESYPDNAEGNIQQSITECNEEDDRISQTMSIDMITRSKSKLRKGIQTGCNECQQLKDKKCKECTEDALIYMNQLHDLTRSFVQSPRLSLNDITNILGMFKPSLPLLILEAT